MTKTGNISHYQSILNLSLRDEATFSNFYAGGNAAVIAALKNCLSGTGELQIYIWGEPGVGCSHLLQACCHAMNECYAAVYLDLKEHETFSPAILEDLGQIDLVCLDHIQAVFNHLDWEEALLRCYEHLREQGKRLIIAGHALPKQLSCRLSDLRSRFSWGLSFRVQALNDTEKVAALIMCAQNRGMVFSETAAQYLLHHTTRSLSALLNTLDRLEKASLIRQHRITIPFIKSVLQLNR